MTARTDGPTAVARGNPAAFPAGIIPPGTEVVIGPGMTFIGTVTAVRITAGPTVEYRCVWWDGKTRHERYLTAGEVEGRDELFAALFPGPAPRIIPGDPGPAGG